MFLSHFTKIPGIPIFELLNYTIEICAGKFPDEIADRNIKIV